MRVAFVCGGFLYGWMGYWTGKLVVILIAVLRKRQRWVSIGDGECGRVLCKTVEGYKLVG